MQIERLISLPPAMAGVFGELEGKPEWFATSDPPGCKLGSGGGTAHLLVSAWQKNGGNKNCAQWLRSGKHLALLAGGQSRRLPAYAAPGKILLPMPVLRWGAGQRLDQSLLDLQLPDYERILAHAPDSHCVLVTSGDVLLTFSQNLPAFPEVDILGLGIWVSAETASHFGVFFTARSRPEEIAFFLQKPSPQEIQQLAREHLFLVDTGMWLLSARAVEVLLRKCGWDEARGEFASGAPGFYELYAEMGLALGTHPQKTDPEIAALTSAVVPLPDAQFNHFGTSRQMIGSVSALQNANLDQTRYSHPGTKPHPDIYVLNSDFAFTSRSSANQNIWVENCALPGGLALAQNNVLTGIPAGNWDWQIEPGVCVDFAPVGGTDFCLRVYGFDDVFKGAIATDPAYLGCPLSEWLVARGLGLDTAAIVPDTDIQDAALFPVLPADQIEAGFVQWLFAAHPDQRPDYTALWLKTRRLSANGIGEQINLPRLYAQRRAFAASAIPRIFANRAVSNFPRMDLAHMAGLLAGSNGKLGAGGTESVMPLELAQEEMFRAAILRSRGEDFSRPEERAFEILRETIVASAARHPATPKRNLIDDQIVWGRSPARLDLAGGWTDTPPYCLKFGGAVVNVAVNLNGQPPVQVFARYTKERGIVIRSIDLGAEIRVRTLEDLREYDRVGAKFSLAKGALALAGFDPRFSGHTGARSLDEVLEAFGGGLEISLLAAAPKGSGLGTSSILAATLLATLSDTCGLKWDTQEVFQRTLVLEQLLTSGGGWQDQAGAIYRGLKMIETLPGMEQRPLVRWLPTNLFGAAYANQTILLYYTGITRMAKDILQEIVRGMFLNRAGQLRLLERIGRQAHIASEAIQRDSWTDLCTAVRGSWELNQALDAGTNPPEVAAILAGVEDYLSAAKLLGAGGGGYLLMLAKDIEAATRIREKLAADPPNALARFVQLDLSESGLQITRS